MGVVTLCAVPVGVCSIARLAGQAQHACRRELFATAPSLSLIAHWGSMAAGKFAGDHPGLVERLVLFAPIARRLMHSVCGAVRTAQRGYVMLHAGD